MRYARVLNGTCLLAACLLNACDTQMPRPPGAEYEGDAFTFHKIQDDIYHAIGTGNLAAGANATIIINENDVLLVDSHISPAAAWALLRELQPITDKPVRYVVNTHFHFDHVHGNQVFPSDVEIIGHEFTREMIATGRTKSGRAYDSFIGTLPDQVADLRRRVEATTDTSQRAELERRLTIQENYVAATDAVEAIPPTTTLARRMTLFRGGREIRLMFFGRGHTGGDVVVYLPQERVLITGDLLTEGIPYMGDGYLQEWAETLEQLKPLEFDVVLPGHGQAFRERQKVDYLQAYLLDLWTKAADMHRRGVSAEEAATRIDMRSHADHFDITNVGVQPHAVLRVYELLEEGGG